MWPIYMGLQVLKSLLFALFLPTIIGSVSRLIGKGKFGFSVNVLLRSDCLNCSTLSYYR